LGLDRPHSVRSPCGYAGVAVRRDPQPTHVVDRPGLADTMAAQRLLSGFFNHARLVSGA
jgi:hypothetical protein